MDFLAAVPVPELESGFHIFPLPKIVASETLRLTGARPAGRTFFQIGKPTEGRGAVCPSGAQRPLGRRDDSGRRQTQKMPRQDDYHGTKAAVE